MAGLMRIFVLALLAFLNASPAEAGPVVGAIQMIAVAIKGFAGLNWFTAFLVRTGLSIGFSLLAKAVQGKPRAQGITADTTTTGGTTPWTFGVGLFATGGQLIAPPNSYGSVGDTPRAYLVYPLALSVVPGCALNRLIVNDAYVPLAAAPSATWGRAVTGDLAGFVQIDYKDGSQTTAQPDMLAAFGADPDRPWTTDMVAPGTCMAYARFRYSRQRFNGLPTLRFEMLGIPLYDPRADSTVGGSGSQRWANRATWAWAANPMVIIYNMLRGIDVGGGMIWGGESAAEDLPLADWFAAMNECDVAVDNGAGGTEPQYRCGMQISVDDEPAAVIEELLKTCSGQLVEIGGVWYPHVGAPALPSYFLTDEDILVTAEQSFDPHPGLADTYNGITAAYPDPAGLWEAKDAPPRYDTAWEAEDGNRRLVADVELRACPWGGQVQRIMAQIIADHRRMRRHQNVVPPEAVTLRPFQTVSWTSARHGYTAKVFEITGITDQLMTLNQGLSLRERDSGDFAWNPVTDLIPVAPAAPVTTPPPAQILPGWSVGPASLVDAASEARIPAILAVWSPDEVQDARGVRIAIRLKGDTTDGRELPVLDPAAGKATISDGILADTEYQLRGLAVLDRETDWTGWTDVTTSYAGPPLADPENLVPDGIFESQNPALVTVTAGGVAFENATTGPGKKMLRWTAAAPGANSQIYQAYNYRFPAVAGAQYFASLMLAAVSAGAADNLQIRVYWYTAANAYLSASTVAAAANYGTGWSTPGDIVIAPLNASYGIWALVRATGAGPDIDVRIKQALVRRASAANLIGIGDIKGQMLAFDAVTANVMSVGWLVGGRLSASFLDVNDMLEIMAGAGLRHGKTGVHSDGTDGIYFGRSGATNFGFAVSRTNGGKRQSIKISDETGLKLLNARHFVTGASLPVTTDVNATLAKTNLPAGIKEIQIDLVAGGGGAQGITNGYSGSKIAGGNGAQGGNTIVKLYDGATLKHTFTVTGGLGGNMGAFTATKSAWNSSKGDGGIGGTQTWISPNGENTRSFTAKSGNAGGFQSTAVVDTSTWAAPAIEVTIGAGGVGGSGAYPGAAGQPGAARYTYSTVTDLPADVVPLKPTATGTFSRVANVAGSFPNLGAGLWVLDTGPAGTGLYLAEVDVGGGIITEIWNVAHATIMSSATPTFSAYSANRTIYYKFYSMGSWG